jgi:uncharacterized surface protein with fasciclin (FAS1) repeats
MKIILDVIHQIPHFSLFFKALVFSGLATHLKSHGPWTVLVPSDQAFLFLSPKGLRDLFKNKAKLAAILSYHIIPGKLRMADIINRKTAMTQLGLPIRIKTDEDIGIKLEDANIIQADIEVGNGIIHSIDSLLIPGLQQDHLSNFDLVSIPT